MEFSNSLTSPRVFLQRCRFPLWPGHRKGSRMRVPGTFSQPLRGPVCIVFSVPVHFLPSFPSRAAPPQPALFSFSRFPSRFPRARPARPTRRVRGGRASGGPALRLPLPHGNATPPPAHWLPAPRSPPPAARHASLAPLAPVPALICMTPRAPMDGRCLLNMQRSGQ